MMTAEPIIISADYTIADALTAVRQGEISPAHSTSIYSYSNKSVLRRPLEPEYVTGTTIPVDGGFVMS